MKQNAVLDFLVRKQMTIVVLIVVAGLVWFIGGAFFREHVQDGTSLSFSVKAEVEVDGVTYTGTSIWHLQEWVMKYPTRVGPYSKVWGEAVVLKGGPRNLFLLRKGVGVESSLGYAPFPVFCEFKNFPANRGWVTWLRYGFNEACEITWNKQLLLPVLLEIPDLSRPETLREVTYEIAERGGSCAIACLRSIWVERTNSGITRGIERVFPVLGTLKYGTTNVVTGEVGQTSRDSVGRPTLVDFSTELGNGKMYSP